MRWAVFLSQVLSLASVRSTDGSDGCCAGRRIAPCWGVIVATKAPPGDEVGTVGVDLAKDVGQVHGVDAAGEIVVRRQLRRSQFLAFFEGRPRCLIGIRACSGAHHWARPLQGIAHEVRLMPPSYVKPSVKRAKTEASEAEAVCGGL